MKRLWHWLLILLPLFSQKEVVACALTPDISEVLNGNGKPKAYFRYVRFGKDSTVKYEQNIPIDEGSKDVWQNLVVQDEVSEDGYSVVYVASEGGAPIYTDDFTVRGYSSPIIAMRDYYPFGMPYGTSSYVWGDWTNYRLKHAPGLPGYTGQPEVDEETWGHAFSNFGARYYDPRLGRWHGPDPAFQLNSPFDFCAGSPMMNVDPDGRFIWAIPIVLAVAGAYVGGSVANHNSDPTMWNYSSGKTWAGMGIGAAVGFGVGFGISAGLSSAGITSGAQLQVAMGWGTTTSAQCAVITGTGASTLTGSSAGAAASAAIYGTTSIVAASAGGTYAYYNVPGVADGVGAGLNAVGQGIVWTGEQIALAAAGVGASLAGLGTPSLNFHDPNWPDGDGFVTWNEAVYQWKYGMGNAIQADVAKLGKLWKYKKFRKFLKNWQKEPINFEKPYRAFNFFDPIFDFDFSESDEARVYGNLLFKRIGRNRFQLPTYDNFDWEDHDGLSMRDFYTWYGRNFRVGDGNPFRINFKGKWSGKF